MIGAWARVLISQVATRVAGVAVFALLVARGIAYDDLGFILIIVSLAGAASSLPAASTAAEVLIHRPLNPSVLRSVLALSFAAHAATIAFTSEPPWLSAAGVVLSSLAGGLFASRWRRAGRHEAGFVLFVAAPAFGRLAVAMFVAPVGSSQLVWMMWVTSVWLLAGPVVGRPKAVGESRASLPSQGPSYVTAATLAAAYLVLQQADIVVVGALVGANAVPKYVAHMRALEALSIVAASGAYVRAASDYSENAARTSWRLAVVYGFFAVVGSGAAFVLMPVLFRVSLDIILWALLAAGYVFNAAALPLIQDAIRLGDRRVARELAAASTVGFIPTIVVLTWLARLHGAAAGTSLGYMLLAWLFLRSRLRTADGVRKLCV